MVDAQSDQESLTMYDENELSMSILNETTSKKYELRKERPYIIYENKYPFFR